MKLESYIGEVFDYQKATQKQLMIETPREILNTINFSDTYLKILTEIRWEKRLCKM